MAKPVGTFIQPVVIGGDDPTFSYAAVDITVAATATDVFGITGSPTKTVYVTRIEFSADATSAGTIDTYLVKRTAANTGGTATNPTPAKHDTADAAATATLVLYSANPSALGTGIDVRGNIYALPAASTTGYPLFPFIWDFGLRNDKPIVLHGAAESLFFNLNGQTIPAGFKLYVNIEWYEE